jgi:general secretion pathway protein M
MIEKLLQSWRAMALRERRMVTAAALSVLFAVVYLLMFEPAWKGVAKLDQELPQLRAQVAQMGALASEARRLGTVPKAIESTEVLQQALQASVQAAGLGNALSELKLSGDLFDLSFSAVPHTAWLTWLDTTLRETRLRVADLSITRQQVAGVIDVRLVLEAPKRGER